MLAESKGSFSRHPKIKEALKKGLHQLDGWDKYIAPQPIKSFVIGTFLREREDSSAGKTSSICFVDPEPEAPQDPVEFPADAVRRANYASWLSLMGLNDVAAGLRSGGMGATHLHRIPVLRLGENKYAVSVMSITYNSSEFRHGLGYQPFSGHGKRIELVGIDLNILRTLGSSLSSFDATGLIGFTPDHRAMTLDWDDSKFYGSIYSDGTLLGELIFEGSIVPERHFDWHEVELWQHTEKN